MYNLDKNKIIFDKNFDFDSLELIGCGANSKVYKIKVFDKDYALKVFNNPEYWNLEKFESKLDLNISSFMSPIRISYLNNKFNGYLMKLCRGSNLLRCNLDISVDQFIKYSDILLNDTNFLSESKFLIQDLSKSNIIFDNGFKVIDIDFYIFCPNWYCNDLIKNKNDITNYNREYAIQILLDIFIRSAKVKNIFEDDRRFNVLKNDCIKGKISLKQFFYKVCSYLCISGEFNIQDVGKKLIKKL